ncbi:MAG: hypothetical protein EP344_06250 [Bacteroidetes bacterium]|nr:MAG: hypothetical protein EP344_06250 [Bacteroidota bacterium]
MAPVNCQAKTPAATHRPGIHGRIPGTNGLNTGMTNKRNMDKKRYKSDKQIVDRGWAAMQATLDKEMPVRRRRRGFIWFWILGLTLPLAGYWTWAQFQPAETPAPIEKKAPAQPRHLQQATVPPHAEKPVAATSATSPAPVSAIEPHHTFAKANGHKSLPVRNNPSVSFSQKQELPPAGSAVITTGQVEPVNGMQPLNSPQIAPEEKLPSKANTPTGPSTVTLATVPTAVVPADPVLSDGVTDPAPTIAANTTPLPADAPVEPAPEIVPAACKTGKSWTFGGTAGVLSGWTSGYAGLTAGLTTEWHAGKKWGLRSGLAYQFRPLRQQSRALVQITTGSYVEATGDLLAFPSNNGTGQISPDQVAAPVYIPVTRLHRLEIPLLAYWEPASRLRLYMGGSVGSTIFAKSGNRGLKDNTVLYIPGDNSANRSLNREVTTQLQRWEAQGTLGLGYRLGRHVSLDMFFHFPLSLQLNKADEVDALYSDTSPAAEYLNAKVISGNNNSSTQNSMVQISASAFF